MNTETGLPSELIPICMIVGPEEIAAYANLSGDFNPIHLDAEAAKASGMADVIAHGMLSLNLIWESIEKSFGFLQNPELSLDVRFKAPVYQNETVETGSARKSARGDYDVWVSNQDGFRVIEGTLRVRI